MAKKPTSNVVFRSANTSHRLEITKDLLRALLRAAQAHNSPTWFIEDCEEEIKCLMGGDGVKCPNCGLPKKESQVVCSKCDKAARVLQKKLEKGITLTFEDGTTEKIVGTKNPRKSTIYGKKR
jgi:hypothetical protein